MDRQYQAVNYDHFGSAVYTECKYSQPGHVRSCADVAACVNLYILDHDNTDRRSFFLAYRDFTEGLIEFVHNEPSIFDEKGHAVKPQGRISDSQRFLGYRIRSNGTILRWSPDAGDWISTNRNIRDESLPLRVHMLIESAKQRGDGAAVRLYQLFLEARNTCYPK